ncbi:MurR/RpiR family transcriptional regulator [Erysipelothrix sp. HDW6C]|uniref:MurR/RpiR family transcriptional regulator n=1 Tax=Erysipelothrix sp. HDW6C TaxID=2714930 RepID=UPI00140789C2|nr:MurR/RpiR family transcriptional regulator [Erysipelothrix sp. HDW6C]QIK69234.1 MurR/RpiR family transcriptional regulator [Erysipelothrix sp. HDW6C]
MLFLKTVPDLSELEFDIYNTVIQYAESIQFMSVRDLAEAAHVSSAAIMRFCKKFECSGFSEFKFRFTDFIANASKPIGVVTPTDEMTLINFLANTTQTPFQEKLTQAIELLKDKELILFAGNGASKVTAQYGSHYFSSFFSMALVIEETMNYPVNHFPKEINDKIAIIACSVSGETGQIIEFLRRYHTSKTTIISITNSSNSTIARLSDVNFPYYINQERTEYADTTSQVPALYILEVLAKALSNERSRKY